MKSTKRNRVFQATAAVLACLTLVVALAGCSKEAKQTGSAGPVPVAQLANAKCPMMGSELTGNVPASLVREFQGKKVGFCCAGCPGAWDKLSDEEKIAKLAKAQ